MESAAALQKRRRSAPQQEVYVGRQPIYDRQLKVVAYELLFRTSSAQDAAEVLDGHLATTQVIVNTFLEIGLDQIVGPAHRAFINLPRQFFLEDCALALPPERVVLEVLEDIEPDPAVLAGVGRLAEQGYVIALDDFLYHEGLQPLVELAQLIKIDIMGMSPATIRDHVQRLRPYGVPLLAEKVESREEFQLCKALGFELYQGFFFCKPNVVRGQRRPSNRLAILRLLSRLQDPDIGAEELETLIVQDVSLSYKILRYINSAALALPRKVESIHQAVVYLGLQTIKRWVTLLSLAGLEDKPLELLVTALVRAKMSEELARAAGRCNLDSYFTVGLFSALDALMDDALEGLLEELPLSETLKAALLRREGPMGEVLSCVLSYERAAWDELPCDDRLRRGLRKAYFSAIAWAETVREGLQTT